MQVQPHTQGQSQKYPYYIVGGGTIIALIGFLFLPYMTMTSTLPQSSSPSSQPLIFSGIQAASVQGFVWLEALLAVAVLLIAALLLFSRNPFGMSRVALQKQVQWGIYIIIGAGVVSLLLQYILMTTIPAGMIGIYSSNMLGFATSVSSFVNSVAMSYNVGSWFYLLGMLAVIGGGVYGMTMVNPAFLARRQAQGQGQMASPYMPQAQNWQQPSGGPVSMYPQDWQSQSPSASSFGQPQQGLQQTEQQYTPYPPQQQQYPQQGWQQPQQQYPPQNPQQAAQQQYTPYPPYPPQQPGQ